VILAALPLWLPANLTGDFPGRYAASVVELNSAAAVGSQSAGHLQEGNINLYVYVEILLYLTQVGD